MLYGMSYDDFWYGKPELATVYRKLHRLQAEQTNQQLWLQGLYIQNAVAVAINNAFSKQKQKYVAEPVRLFPMTEDEKETKAEETRQKLIAKLNAWKDAFNKSKGNK